MLALTGLLALTAAACSSGGDGEDDSSGVTRTPSPTATTPLQRLSPTVTPTAPAQSIIEPAARAFTSELLSLDYTTDWRISGRTENSVTYTLVERPGDAVFSVQWTPGASSDSVDVFVERLELLAAEVVRLEDIRIGDHTARRYLSLFLDGDQVSQLVLNLMVNVSGTGYLVTFVAPPDDFPQHVEKAEEFIARIQIP